MESTGESWEEKRSLPEHSRGAVPTKAPGMRSKLPWTLQTSTVGNRIPLNDPVHATGRRGITQWSPPWIPAPRSCEMEEIDCSVKFQGSLWGSVGNLVTTTYTAYQSLSIGSEGRNLGGIHPQVPIQSSDIMDLDFPSLHSDKRMRRLISEVETMEMRAHRVVRGGTCNKKSFVIWESLFQCHSL